MNIAEASKFLGIKTDSLRVATERKAIKYQIVEGQKEFTIEELRAYKERQESRRMSGLEFKLRRLNPAANTKRNPEKTKFIETHRPMQKVIVDDLGNEYTFTQCSSCKEFKSRNYQYNKCATCLHPDFKKLVGVMNQVRGLSA